MITANLVADDREFEYLMIFLDVKIDLQVFAKKYLLTSATPKLADQMDEEVQFNI